MCGSVCSTLRLPQELVSGILLVACGDAVKDYVKFYRRRGELSQLCVQWRTAVLQCVEFWTYIRITQRMPLKLLELWLDRTAAADLRLEVYFENLAEYYGAEPVPRRICEYTASILPLILPRAGQWTHLSLDIESTKCLSQMLQAIDAVAPVTLQVLEILSRPYAGITYHSDDVHLVSVPAKLCLAPHVQRLSLYSVTMDWFGFTSFDSLEVLELCNFVHPYFPKWEDFVELLGQALHLRRLILRSVGCRGCPVSKTAPVILLPSLVELEVEFRSHISVAEFVCRLQMPKLDSISLYFRAGSDMQCLSLCLDAHPTLFYSATQLTLAGYLVYTDHVVAEIARLYRLSWKVRVLNTSDASPLFFRALLHGENSETYAVDPPQADASARVVILPVLEELLVFGSDAPALRTFVDARKQAGVPLKRLFVDYPPPSKLPIWWPDMDHIQSQVETLSVPRITMERPTALVSRYVPGVDL